ncbi:AtpZ/AtpI family protein [Candidatus Uhrbacteria bacterium]|nr:AtpZ/AtpI family protein [Candidatus Uhrbacteria bacterium]
MQKSDNNPQLLGLALQMGYLIAIPLVAFALVGRFVDSIFGSSPLFFLIGILLAIILSTILVYRKTTMLLKDAEDKNDTGSRPSAG